MMGSSLYPRLTEILRASGCTFVRQGKGSHEIWHSPVNGKRFSVPFTIASKATANAIIRQAGLTVRI